MYALKNSPQSSGNVIRLSPYQTPVHYIEVGEAEEKKEYFTGLIPQEVIARRLRVTCKTLVQYRQVALGYDGESFSENKGIGQYRESAYSRSPDFVSRKADAMIARYAGGYAREVYPDEPPFTDYEAWCLEQIGNLYKKMRRRTAVEGYIQRNPQLFTKEQFKCHNHSN